MDLSIPNLAGHKAPTRGRLQGAFGRVYNFVDQLDATGLSRSLLAEVAGVVRRPLGSGAAVGRFLLGEVSSLVTSAARMAGAPLTGPLSPPTKDRRFSDRAWEENAFFYHLLQEHLLRERLAQELIDAAAMSPTQAGKARFMSQLVVDVLSPSNFLWTNPAALKRAFETGGLSVVRAS